MSQAQTTLAQSPNPANGTTDAAPRPRTDKEQNWRQIRQSVEHWRERAQKAEARVAELDGKGVARDKQIAEAYGRGYADKGREIIFAERLAAARERFQDFDRAWTDVRPLIPGAVLAEIAEHPYGLPAAYMLRLSKPVLEELASLDPQAAVIRFRHWADDLAALSSEKG